MTTLEKVGEIIVKVKNNQIAADAIKPELRLSEDLGLDSIGLVEAFVLAEEAFKTTISQQDVVSLNTVADLVAYIDARRPR